MSKPKKVLLAAIMAAILTTSGTVSSSARDNAAAAINTRDGSSVFRLAFNVHRLMSDVVESTNAAVAFSSCEDCRTIAVAIQLVLILSDPDVVSPENYAIAINSDCDLCTTVALAYQYVVTTGGPMRFDAEGNREIAEIRRAMQTLVRNEELAPDELRHEFGSLYARLKSVVGDHMIAAGPPPHSSPEAEAGARPDETGGASATPTPANDDPTPSPSPEPKETPSQEATHDDSPGPSPS